MRFNAVAGIIYFIQVDYGNDQGSFTFRMRKLTPPANDNFASPSTIGPALPATVLATTVDSTWEAGEPAALGGSGSSRSIWFSWTAPSTGRVRLDVCQYTFIDGSANNLLGVYTGATLGTIVPTVPTTTNCELDFPATAGVNYKVAYSAYIKGELNLALKLFSAPPPANDDFANASAVGPGLPVSVAGNNDFATAQAGEPDHSGIGPPAHSAWYTWTPAQTSRVRIGACSKDFDGARVGVYTGAAVNALTQVAELPGFAPHCRVAMNAVAGTTYRIAAAGGPQDGLHGPFTLDIHAEKKPANDELADAQVIGNALPVTINGTTVDATVVDGEPSTDTYSGYRNPSVWYRWTAPSDDAMIFSACSTGEPVVLAVFSGTAFGDDFDFVDADETACRSGKGGRLAIAPVAGQTYSIVVESIERDYDTAFTLSAIGPPKAPVITPPKKSFNLKKAIKKCKKIKSKKKRTNCIRKARKKAAIIKCKKLKNSGKRNKCHQESAQEIPLNLRSAVRLSRQ